MNNKSKVIASAGVFSEGAGDGSSKRLMSRYRDTNDSESASTLRRPTITKKAKADPEAEQKHIREIFDLDDDPMNGENQLENDDFGPINMLQGTQCLAFAVCLFFFLVSFAIISF